MKLWWTIKAWLFDLIRPLFVGDVDRNEDYNCVICGAPVLRRYLTCSTKCEVEFEKDGL